MISKSLNFINDALDQFLRNRFGLDESKVLLNNVVESNGSIPQSNFNKVIVSLINIEKETAKPFVVRNQVLANGNYSNINQAERYNIDILISANFENYSETLKFISAVIAFFQVNTAFTSGNFSTIPAGISKLEIDNEKISYRDMQNLWTAMGAKYQPSIIYKMRLITIQGYETTEFVPAVTRTATQVIA